MTERIIFDGDGVLINAGGAPRGSPRRPGPARDPHRLAHRDRGQPVHRPEQGAASAPPPNIQADAANPAVIESFTTARQAIWACVR